MNKQLIYRAEAFARNAHKNQLRDGGQPYIIHPEQVAGIIAMATNDENMIAAAWLHDTIEDCGVTRDQLAQEFNETVADLVVEVTHIKVNGVSTFPNLRTRDGIMLKFADRLSNLSGMETWTDAEIERYLGKSRFWK